MLQKGELCANISSGSLLHKADLVYHLRVDLTAASCVHMIEPQWNPMVEAQALDRVHRIGQDRDVTITRYIVKDSIELVCSSSHI